MVVIVSQKELELKMGMLGVKELARPYQEMILTVPRNFEVLRALENARLRGTVQCTRDQSLFSLAPIAWDGQLHHGLRTSPSQGH